MPPLHRPRSVSAVVFEGSSLRRTAASAVGVLALVGVARGQGEEAFFPGAFHSQYGFQTAIASADFDVDGREDVLVAATGSLVTNRRLSLLLGDGTGALAAPTTIPVGVLVTALVVGDLDQDGDPDVVASTQSASLRVFLSDGAGGFGPAQSVATAGGIGALALGDVDLDGDLDLATANNFNDVSIFFGDGSGALSAPVSTVVGTSPRGIALGDLDQDGDLDLVVTRDTGAVDVLTNDGTGGFSIFDTLMIAGAAFQVRLVDLDADLDLDFIAGIPVAGDVIVLLGDGATGFASPTYFGVDDFATLTGVVDVDGDGRLDALAGSNQQDSVSVLRGNGIGGFLPATIVRGVRGGPMTIGDLDGDGRHDVIATADPLSEDVGGIRYFRGDGHGDFRTGLRTLIGSFPLALVSGDVSGDTRPDLVSVGGSSVSLLLNDGAGHFPPTATVIGPALTAELADINADGDLDLLAGVSTTVVRRLGDGTGTFGSPASFPIGVTPVFLTSGDVNGDGGIDVVSANGGSNSFSVVLGDGVGGFGAVSHFAAGTNTKHVALGDLDADGDLDVVAANNGGFGVSVHLNDGAGGFPAPSHLFIASGSWSVALGHLDGDGQLDLVLADSGARTLVRALGDGAGGFGPAVNVSTGAHPRRVVLGDFDGDLALDAAVTCSDQGTFAIHYGDGSGNLGPAVAHTADGKPFAMAVADFDGDGRLDVSTADNAGNRATVYTNEIPPEAGTPFCSGDGSLATACPCANTGDAGRGCANSQSGSVGALLTGSGRTGPDTVVLTASDMLPTALSIFLQGNATNTGGVPFGDGVRCVGGQLLRIGLETASGGIASYPQLGDPSISAKSALLGGPIPSGATRWYQTYYRDPDPSFCAAPTGNTWNVTNGIWIAW